MRRSIVTYTITLSLILVAMMGFIVGCTLTGEYIPPTATPDIPSVEFLFPQNGSQVFEGTDMEIDLVARDNSGQGITRVDLFVDAFTDQEPYLSVSPTEAEAVPVFRVNSNWFAQGVGNHQMTAIAYRADGLQSFETTIVIEVLARDATESTTPTVGSN